MQVFALGISSTLAKWQHLNQTNILQAFFNVANRKSIRTLVYVLPTFPKVCKLIMTGLYTHNLSN